MKHWTEDDFLHWLYAGEAPSASLNFEQLDLEHLRDCDQCRARTTQMTAQRRQAATPPDLSWDFLAAERRSIYRRLGAEIPSTRSIARRWAVGLASLAGIVALSLTTLHPWTGKTAVYTSSDAKLFSDLASIEQSSEPRAIRPIHNLFQE